MSDREKLIRELYKLDPECIVVAKADYETAEHQTYKALYKLCRDKLNQINEENYNLRSSLDELERDAATEKMVSSSKMELKRLLDAFLDSDITVSAISAYDKTDNKIMTEADTRKMPENLSNYPGVYDFHRPSWFTELRTELNQENMQQKNVRQTKGFLNGFLDGIKKTSHVLKEIEHQDNRDSVSKAAEQIDMRRRKQIIHILRDDCSNEEKYLKYLIITPGISKDYASTVLGAAKLGLDANIIIELLEQPVESFNKEVLELYVSEVYKSNEYNLKKELAEELVRGEWFVKADINGTAEKFQLVPLEQLKKMYSSFENLRACLDSDSKNELCANLAQSSKTSEYENSDINENEYEISGINIEEPDFDDSQIFFS